MKHWAFFPLTATRFAVADTKLFFGRCGPTLWRFVVQDESGFAIVGEQYRSKTELLSDLSRYAAQYGF